MLTNLKIQRLKAGFRQVDLAEKSRLPQYRISLIERGVIPFKQEASALASALEMPVESLFSDFQEDPQTNGCQSG